MSIVKLSLISVIALSTLGCASKVSNKLRQGGIESKELYRQAAGEDKRGAGRYLDVKRAKNMIGSEARYEPYTRTAINETEQLFQLLPNPKISIYVYPHLSTRDNAPVPGYTSAVSLYKADEYALPKEVIAQGVVQPGDPLLDIETSDVPIKEQLSTEIELIKELNKRAGGGDQ